MYSFFDRGTSAWIIIRVKSLCQDQSGSNTVPNSLLQGDSNTRVYLDIKKAENKAVVTIRNISENQLNISAKELMERFVRGDSSRSTEGNGLGLSIAENLAVLQGGRLTVEISGDLFTATVEFLIE